MICDDHFPFSLVGNNIYNPFQGTIGFPVCPVCPVWWDFRTWFPAVSAPFCELRPAWSWIVFVTFYSKECKHGTWTTRQPWIFNTEPHSGLVSWNKPPHVWFISLSDIQPYTYWYWEDVCKPQKTYFSLTQRFATGCQYGQLFTPQKTKKQLLLFFGGN